MFTFIISACIVAVLSLIGFVIRLIVTGSTSFIAGFIRGWRSGGEASPEEEQALDEMTAILIEEYESLGFELEPENEEARKRLERARKAVPERERNLFGMFHLVYMLRNDLNQREEWIAAMRKAESFTGIRIRPDLEKMVKEGFQPEELLELEEEERLDLAAMKALELERLGCSLRFTGRSVRDRMEELRGEQTAEDAASADEVLRRVREDPIIEQMMRRFAADLEKEGVDIVETPW